MLKAILKKVLYGAWGTGEVSALFANTHALPAQLSATGMVSRKNNAVISALYSEASRGIPPAARSWLIACVSAEEK